MNLKVNAENEKQILENSKLSDEIEKLLEISGFFLFALYIINFMLGKFQNFNSLDKWNENTKDLYHSEYSHVGFSKEGEELMPFM